MGVSCSKLNDQNLFVNDQNLVEEIPPLKHSDRNLTNHQPDQIPAISSDQILIENDQNLINNLTHYIPKITQGKVIKVYDGDTFTVMAFLHDNYYKFHIRLSGIDCPEIKTQNQTEHKYATHVRNQLHQLIHNKTIKLNYTKLDKYGRILANAYLDNLHINQWLLDNKFAVPYDGKTKPITNWHTYIN